jgi:uncharacterized protein
VKPPLIIHLGSLKQGDNVLEFEFPPRDLGLDEHEVTENPMFEQIVGPVLVKAVILRNGQRFLVRGEVLFRARLDCALCDRRYELDFHDPLSAEFLSCAPSADEQLCLDRDELVRVRVHADSIDLAPLVRDAIHLAVPIAPVCTPECRGLCPTCGADLNLGPCSCLPAPGDGIR